MGAGPLIARTRRLDADVDLFEVAGTEGTVWVGDRRGLAGQGEALRLTVPPGDPAAAAAAVHDVLGAIEVDDQVEVPGTGPVALGALPFDPACPGELVVPRVIVGRADDGTRWVTHLLGPGVPIPELEVPDGPDTGPAPTRFTVTSPRSTQDWQASLLAVRDELRRETARKVVLARELIVEADAPIRRADVLSQLRAAYPSCMLFALDGFVGATPELLVARSGDQVRSHPMAGTAPRSSDPSTDARLAANLLASAKDRVEHRYTIDMVHDTLLPWCSFLDEEAEPSIVAMANVQHLATLVEGRLSSPAASVIELMRALHPTPAVNGTPREVALELIAAHEGIDRGRYAGPVGWVDADRQRRMGGGHPQRRAAGQPGPPLRRRGGRRRLGPRRRAGRDPGQVPGPPRRHHPPLTPPKRRPRSGVDPDRPWRCSGTPERVGVVDRLVTWHGAPASPATSRPRGGAMAVVHPRPIDEIVWGISSEHHGLISRSQMTEAGISPSAIQLRVADGRLVRLGPTVYRVPGGPESYRQAILAHCLSAGRLALASHRTAAGLWLLDGITPGPIEVTMPRHKRRKRSTATVHESRDLRGVDATSLGPIPLTSPIRTLLDLGSVVHPYRLEQALDDALRRRLVHLDDLFHRFQEVARRGRPGIGPLRPLLEERLGSPILVGSAFESATRRLIQDAGLVTPVSQHPVELDDGTVIYLDLSWPDRLLAIECDSLAHHFAADRLRWDDRRQNALVMKGWMVLRVTWQDVTQRPGRPSRCSGEPSPPAHPVLASILSAMAMLRDARTGEEGEAGERQVDRAAATAAFSSSWMATFSARSVRTMSTCTPPSAVDSSTAGARSTWRSIVRLLMPWAATRPARSTPWGVP